MNQFKKGDLVIIQRELYHIKDEPVGSWAKFYRAYDSFEFEGYLGRLVQKVLPMNLAPKDGRHFKIVDQSEVYDAYYDSNPNIEFTTKEGVSSFSQRIFLNAEGWVPYHQSELSQ